MKNIAKIIVLVILVTFASCKDKNADAKENSVENNQEQLYSCSMHPEVHGKKGEECSVCGMELTEPVK
jgi:formamidopyrimidine-DNA glycosylase